MKSKSETLVKIQNKLKTHKTHLKELKTKKDRWIRNILVVKE